MTIEELEAKVRLLEDIEAIKKLFARFCYLVDSGDWDELMTHFTDDAVADFPASPFGRHEGKVGVARLFKELLVFDFMVHMCHNPIIEVNGEKATGEWYYEVPATHKQQKKAIWLVGKYENEFVKVGGEWKIKALVGHMYYVTPYDEGWVKTRMCEV